MTDSKATDTDILATDPSAPTVPLPDRLATSPKSPFYNADVLEHDVGIRFNGVEKNNVDEYCVSEGWIRVAAGKGKDRLGNAITVKLKGHVEPYYRART